MNPLDRAYAVLRHAERHNLGQYMAHLSLKPLGVQLYGGGLAALIAWGQSLRTATAEVALYGNTLHVVVSGHAAGIALNVVTVLVDGPEFEYLTEMAVAGRIELDRLQRFVHEEVE